ncbi:toll/interleukin-1 receptor domain-containing protein [Paenibacillus filicis]|uniref:Toll/interleukin-1 receptor domain-containing protein n=1 Tax=Paenibacillus gyeongsangnamensis TaxID=3388067 RepID=A0ABT4QBS1_9BACL|nr:toll/interleukin-1 receptor domain-containing protein [Paenibacillus filicis]MCZ8514337.1 toll/interleukin-1 receptor domain-containing protein [Paenibacillus filicis]
MKSFIIGGLTEDISQSNFINACEEIGKNLAKLGNSLVICSPFQDSADYWVLKGFVGEELSETQSIDIIYVDSKEVTEKVNDLKKNLILKNLNIIPCISSSLKGEYSWLLCQLQAMDLCQTVIAIGGKNNGAANMLLLLAESKRKNVLPFPFFGGAASDSFERIRYQLEDKMGNMHLKLLDPNKISESLELSIKESIQNNMLNKQIDKNIFFISYPKARPHEADYIENILRRRNHIVYRDETEFGVGKNILNEIEKNIRSANIFIATWCKEYACSPWCFDELELALDLSESRGMKVWIFNVDGTRLIPKRARNILTYPVRTREELEGTLLLLLGSKIMNTD